jgi:hypothetical protein
LWLNIVSFVNTYAAVIGMTNGGWKFYILYLCVDVAGIDVIYLLTRRASRCKKLVRNLFSVQHPDFAFFPSRFAEHGQTERTLDGIFADLHLVETLLRKQKVMVTAER